MKRSKPPKRSPLPPRTARPNAVNRKRKAKHHERAYGEKREFVAGMICLACGHSPCEPAHVGTAGAGMKAGSERLVPLCGPRFKPYYQDGAFRSKLVEGCHAESHRGIKTFQRKYGIDLKAEAARIEREWHSYSGGDDGE